jgi:DNA-binding GntR family transcriptional regulator
VHDEMRVQRQAPIREQVAAILRKAIMDFHFMPGQLLVERQLCEVTLASRPSVREALRQLEVEGLVESRNGRGVYVTVVAPTVARNVYDVRAELEGLAAELFTERADTASRRRLWQSVAELTNTIADGASTAAILAAKNDFYDTLFHGAGNPIVKDLVRTLHRRLNQLRALTLAQPGRPAQTLVEICAILDAIDRGDAAAARAAARQHVRRAAEVGLEVLVQQETLEPPLVPLPRVARIDT